MARKHWGKPYQKINPKRILKHIWTDDTKLNKHIVIEEMDTHYICYKEYYQQKYVVHKNKRVYTDHNELKYVRWVRITHKKPSSYKRRRFLENTKMTEFRDRYIKEFPEYLV